MMGLPVQERSYTISSVVWMQYTKVTDGQTDGRTPVDRQQRLRLHIASRGKNYFKTIGRQRSQPTAWHITT